MKRKVLSFSLAVLMCAMTACDVKDKKEEKIKVRSKGPTETTETTETTEEAIPPIVEDQGEPVYKETTVETVADYEWEEYVFDDDEYKYMVVNDWEGYCHLIANGDVYFKVGNDIVKYDNGKKTVVYTADGDDFYGFMFWTDGIIELIYFSSGDRFLVEGEEYKALDGIADFEVKMFDGSTRIFTIDQIYCLQVIYS